MRHIIIGFSLISWMAISIVLALFAGMGIFMMFMTICHIGLILSLYKLEIIEMIRGKNYTQVQRVKIKQITTSVIFKFLFIVNSIMSVGGTVILMFHNVRLIDYISK